LSEGRQEDSVGRMSRSSVLIYRDVSSAPAILSRVSEEIGDTLVRRTTVVGDN